MFSLNMLDYPMSFLSLFTWTWNNFPTLRSNFAFYLNPVLPLRPSKSYRVGGVVVAHEILVTAQRLNSPLPLDLTGTGTWSRAFQFIFF